MTALTEEEEGDEVKAEEAWKEIEIGCEIKLQQLYHRVTISRYCLCERI